MNLLFAFTEAEAYVAAATKAAFDAVAAAATAVVANSQSIQWAWIGQQLLTLAPTIFAIAAKIPAKDPQFREKLESEADAILNSLLIVAKPLLKDTFQAFETTAEAILNASIESMVPADLTPTPATK